MVSWGEYPLPVAIGAVIVGCPSRCGGRRACAGSLSGETRSTSIAACGRIPRRYERPLYGRVVRIDKAVYVGKQDPPSLINPTASPMLRSEDEARWIASEMRRALRETSRRVAVPPRPMPRCDELVY